MNISIIDYYTGNTMSLISALNILGHTPNITNKKEIQKSDILILPGVGSFGRAMHNIKNLDLLENINDHVKKGKKLIGICLGMQLLFTKSYESEVNYGLNLIEGDVIRLKTGKEKIPNVGLKKTKWLDERNFLNFDNKEYYFTHSFVASPTNKNDIITEFSHNQNTYCCGVKKDNIYGFQFHPELSASNGIKLLKKIIDI